MFIGGLDIGTTGCKLTVFDETGRYYDKAYRDYPVNRGSSESTLDAESIMVGVTAVIKEIAAKYPDLKGFGVTSFGETFVMTDDEGKPLAPSMLYTDSRGKSEREELERKLGSRHIAEICGARPHETFSLPKLMWMKEHQPEIYSKAKHVFLIEDFVVFRLTGVAQIDYSLAARTMGFDIHTLTWSEEIFEAAGIDPSLFSTPVPTGTVAGTITESISELTGLSADTVIVSISHDQVSAAVGSGVFSSEVAVDGAGTVECVTPVYDEVPPMDVMYDGNYAVVPYVIPGKYVCYAYETTGGALMQWCTETIAKKEKELAAELGISVNSYLENQFVDSHDADTPGNLLVLPHFAGAATPYMDTESKGAILGLTAATTAADIYRGCMEGVVYEMLLNIDHLKRSGLTFTSIKATGGGAHSAIWMQMKADMWNVQITALETLDAGTVGSAMLTGVALGCFKNLEDAASHMVVEKKTYEPNPVMHEKYMKNYERYKLLYEAVKPLV